MRLCIPGIGTRLTLAQSWSFDLYHERRNDRLLTALFGHWDTWASFSGCITRWGSLMRTDPRREREWKCSGCVCWRQAATTGAVPVRN